MNTINNLIEDFSTGKLKQFFLQAITTFKPETENYSYLFEDNENIKNNYKEIVKLGEAEFSNTEDLLVLTAETISPLTSRTGKKRQYEIAKKILKEENKDAAIFVFYDSNGNFRFSFIKANFLGTKRDYSSYKRYTYFVSPELTNKTFINRITKTDFSSLEKIQEAFSVTPITKEFYEKLQHWYFWALNNVKFPDDAENEKNGREVAVIRLITRIMFIWFMKVRKLVPNNIFDEKNIKEKLKNFSPESSTYYKAVLQNLFFATLNTEHKDRKFRSEVRNNKGYNPDFGNHNVYRYSYFFKSEDSIKTLFGKIPFLNGGLFECLDYKTKEKKERKYIDGFTDTKEQQPKVPNFLFFAEQQNVDISSFFEKTNKTYEVEGLINLLNSYNFTIDENEPDDIEVALDPELLGSIFENLLASYNPETATTARKATGSFYTPREIVNYMTNESLKQYFKTNLKIDAEIEKKLDSLINAKKSENPFVEETSKRLIILINNLRVVDPAVGSGAFPMAMLNKLVFILGKLDPENIFWKQSQIDGIKKSISDPSLQRKLIEQIEKQFKEKNADYGRKLYLIQKCIYGVDIQQIAVEIAKLRFFISLLVDEKIDWDKPESNYGIEPLPNLDFKLMQGNSLISTFAGIDFNDSGIENEQKENMLFDDESSDYKLLIKEFEELKNEYQNETDNKKKKELRNKIDETIIEIFEEKLKKEQTEYFSKLEEIKEKSKTLPNEKSRNAYLEIETEKLNRKQKFDIKKIEKDLIDFTEARKPKDFFLWNVYFAEVFFNSHEFTNNGFDIVIGNPPYIQLQKAVNGRLKFADLYKNENYETFERTGDIYALFYEKGIDILADKGALCYITSNKWMRANYGKSLRKFFSENNPLKLIDLGPGVFNTATVDTNILLIQKIRVSVANKNAANARIKKLKALTLNKNEQLNKLYDNSFVTLTNLTEESWIILNKEEQKIKEKIERIGTPLKDWDINIYRGVLTGFNEAFIIDGKTKDELIAKDPKSSEIIKPILRGRDIKRYKAEFADLWLINSHNGYKNSEGKRIPPIDINDYPAIKEHLDQYWNKLKKRQDKGKTHYNLRNCSYIEEFEKEKIVYMEIQTDNKKEGYDFPSFAFGMKGTIVLNTAYVLTGIGYKYILGLLNSSLGERLVKFYVTQLQKRQFRMLAMYVDNFPIPRITKESQKPFETLVDKIITKKEHGEDTTAEERQIDIMVYKLYELTYDEVQIVEPEFALTKEEYENYK